MNDTTYDLEIRTAAFAKGVIQVCKTLRQNAVSRPLISQIVSSSTSIGANYREANNASSLKDFAYKISLCKKEAAETSYWLDMLSIAAEINLALLLDECLQLRKIFSTVYASSINKLEILK